jgi:hypothetical protein
MNSIAAWRCRLRESPGPRSPAACGKSAGVFQPLRGAADDRFATASPICQTQHASCRLFAADTAVCWIRLRRVERPMGVATTTDGRGRETLVLVWPRESYLPAGWIASALLTVVADVAAVDGFIREVIPCIAPLRSSGRLVERRFSKSGFMEDCNRGLGRSHTGAAARHWRPPARHWRLAEVLIGVAGQSFRSIFQPAPPRIGAGL